MYSMPRAGKYSAAGPPSQSPSRMRDPGPGSTDVNSLKLTLIEKVALCKTIAEVENVARLVVPPPPPPPQSVRGSPISVGEQRTFAAPRNAGANELLALLRKSLARTGSTGILGFGRKFRLIDRSRNGRIDMEEFEAVIKLHQLGLDRRSTETLFRAFDRNHDGHISYDEFIVSLRGELNQRRKDMISMAFAVLDVDGNGVVTIEDLSGRYDASQHPDVKSGKKTAAEVLLEFLATFDGGSASDGKVTPDDFLLYYAGVSAYIDDDDYFELMIRNCWHISGGKGWCENTTNRRVLVTHWDGRQTVQEIKNDIGIGREDRQAMMQNLYDQGIKDIKTIALAGDPPRAAQESGGGNANGRGYGSPSLAQSYRSARDDVDSSASPNKALSYSRGYRNKSNVRLG